MVLYECRSIEAADKFLEAAGLVTIDCPGANGCLVPRERGSSYPTCEDCADSQSPAHVGLRFYNMVSIFPVKNPHPEIKRVLDRVHNAWNEDTMGLVVASEFQI